MKEVKLKQDMEKYEDTNTLREEFVEWVLKEERSLGEITTYWLNKFNQKLEEIEVETEKLKRKYYEKEMFMNHRNEYNGGVNKGLDLALQIIKNKKN